MKIDPDAPACPRTITEYNPGTECREVTSEGGLTIRAEIAARVLAGMASEIGPHINERQAVVTSVRITDALIAELNKDK